ncbi:MAG: hypothetical protein AAF447_06050 [Myxococcota bacterium]
MSVSLAFCAADEEAELQAFLEAHWRRDHVFVHAPELLRFQHLDAHDPGRLNFVVARDGGADGGAMLAALGFIPLRQYGVAAGPVDVMLAIWKVRDDAPPGLGLALLKFLRGRLRPRLIGAFGLSEMVVPLYRALGYQVGTAGHHALFHPDAPGEGIALRPGAPVLPPADAAGWSLRPLDLTEESDALRALADAQAPFKPRGYLRHRFAAHPVYRYAASGVFEGRELRAAVVWRRQPACNRSCLRIVDLWGDDAALGHVGTSLLRLLEDEGADYLDLVEVGADENALRAAGFLSPSLHGPVSQSRTSHGRTSQSRMARAGLVLPSYFDPFERRNVALSYAFKAPKDTPRVRLFRGDSDQDRPNRMPRRAAA